ncbi:hypothetical protein EDI_044730 [Entamoeba dispar SAW760]|uniref:DUF676 domain-containing protein n=1 Tax=Entamoeba dispar (strain ATCC PRA-260 / SAW760) TaxID=370354 RepID=B0EHX3_ENTDS|nr:uncharacterized protein EDI_044730 [Entamoeba dispar SAW760]EDR25917.1 hypothetical protein EDI_044730 [Entamoeba dispar SAW760]|eukprot:EDR25917.1 hypothetical protein EDI_044730 [Entamoeba dispar SAW760]
MSDKETISKDTYTEQKKPTIDYFFFVHGLLALSINPKEHWAPFANALKNELQTNYIMKYCKSNSERVKTLDGIEVGGLRIANEICGYLKRSQQKRGDEKYRIHFIGHSLGGLYLRFAIPILFKRGIFNNLNWIPFSFMTLETPHLGVQKPLNNGSFDSMYRVISDVVFEGLTMSELQLQDRPFPPYDPTCLKEYPLLLRIVENDIIAPLKEFKHLTLVQNIRFSFQVPYVSSSIDRAIPYDREFLKDQFLLDGFDFPNQYNDLISGCNKHYQLQDERGEIFEERIDGCVVYDRIIKQLNTLNWRRLNVHFRTKSSDAHIFIMGQMNRKRLFKNWGNDDIASYLDTLCKLIKRDIDIENGDIEILSPIQDEPKSQEIIQSAQPSTEEKLIDIQNPETLPLKDETNETNHPQIL